MKTYLGSLVISLVFLAGISLSNGYAAEINDDMLLDSELVEENHTIADPIEPLNRVFFQFNDKLYTWVLEPVARSYSYVLPADIRSCIANAFSNILAPVRIVNNLLQGKVEDSGTELARFVINTIAGAGGLGDPAGEVFNLTIKKEDLGQTFGTYGFGEGFYICWPVFGPSNLRDSIGLAGDAFLNPVTYLAFSSDRAGFLVQSGKIINKTSLNLGEYEQFVESSFDPYTAMRDFYTESRRSKIADRDRLPDNKYHEQSEGDKTNEKQTSSLTEESLGGSELLDLNNVEQMSGHMLTRSSSNHTLLFKNKTIAYNEIVLSRNIAD